MFLTVEIGIENADGLTKTRHFRGRRSNECHQALVNLARRD
jgi:hypothetical protein